MAASSGPDVIDAGLVLALDAADRNSYPGSGTTWTNLVSSGIGTLTNGPTFSSSNGGSIVFDGTDDYVAPSGITDSFLQGTWTASFWVNFDTSSTTSNGTTDKTLLQHGVGSTRTILHLCQRNNRIYFGLGEDDISGTTILSTGRWYNLVFTLNNTTRVKQIYLNGAFEISHTAAGAYVGSGNNARIGGVVAVFGLTFDGFMSNCSFYNRVLTAAEISQNYNALRGRFNV
jgi:hypothetical protein